MTKVEALNLIRRGLECLMDSERPCRDSLSAIECSLDADDCELAITFIEETGQLEKKRWSFVATADEMDEKDWIEPATNWSDDL
jgi:hypothetical protein